MSRQMIFIKNNTNQNLPVDTNDGSGTKAMEGNGSVILIDCHCRLPTIKTKRRVVLCTVWDPTEMPRLNWPSNKKLDLTVKFIPLTWVPIDNPSNGRGQTFINGALPPNLRYKGYPIPDQIYDNNGDNSKVWPKRYKP
eukprot:scaffold810_cov163-Amphora_coffeaeformis.AAC.2